MKELDTKRNIPLGIFLAFITFILFLVSIILAVAPLEKVSHLAHYIALALCILIMLILTLASAKALRRPIKYLEPLNSSLLENDPLSISSSESDTISLDNTLQKRQLISRPKRNYFFDFIYLGLFFIFLYAGYKAKYEIGAISPGIKAILACTPIIVCLLLATNDYTKLNAKIFQLCQPNFPPILKLNSTGMTFPILLFLYNDWNVKYFLNLSQASVTIKWKDIKSWQNIPYTYNSRAYYKGPYYKLELASEVPGFKNHTVRLYNYFTTEQEKRLFDFAQHHMGVPIQLS